MVRYRYTRWDNHMCETMDGTGPYDIPIIVGESYEPCDFVGFDKMNVCKDPENTCIHFFRDDYMFERVWRKPDYYLDQFRRFNAVLSPDFSMYTDWPVAGQIFNHFKKHWIAAKMQKMGIRVYPTISWSDQSSYAWCFDGEPKRATVCVSSVGALRDPIAKKLFLSGYHAMMERLEPETVIFYGLVPAELEGNIVNIEPFTKEIIRRCLK